MGHTILVNPTDSCCSIWAQKCFTFPAVNLRVCCLPHFAEEREHVGGEFSFGLHSIISYCKTHKKSSTDAKTWSYGSVLWCKQQSRSNSQAKKKCRVCLPANPYVPELRLSKHSDVKMSHATAYYRLCPALNLLFIILLFKSSLFISSSLFPIFIFLIMSPFSSSPHLLL